jgi:alkylation response protein AidB-like acyl-CoA dehydrogenase
MNTTGNRWLELVDEIGPGFDRDADKRDADDEFVASHYEILKESGLVSALVPEEFGGGGASYATMAAVLKRLAYWDASTALALSMHEHLVAFQRFNHLHGRPAPLLPRVAAEQIVMVSTGGRDWMKSSGTTERVEGGYVVSARKSFASGSPAAAVAITSAPYDDPDEGPQVIHFALPLTAEGVRLEDDWQTHGMRATGSGAIVMERVFVPDSAISLKRPREGFAAIFNAVAPCAMPFIAGVYVGVAQRAAEIGLELARKRAPDPAVQWSVGEMMSSLTLAKTAHRAAVALNCEFNFSPTMELTDRVFMLKTAAVESAQRTVERAMEAAGGDGFYRRFGLERLLRDVRAGNYHPLPAKHQVLLSGRLALGLEPIP